MLQLLVATATNGCTMVSSQMPKLATVELHSCILLLSFHSACYLSNSGSFHAIKAIKGRSLGGWHLFIYLNLMFHSFPSSKSFPYGLLHIKTSHFLPSSKSFPFQSACLCKVMIQVPCWELQSYMVEWSKLASPFELLGTTRSDFPNLQLVASQKSRGGRSPEVLKQNIQQFQGQLGSAAT